MPLRQSEDEQKHSNEWSARAEDEADGKVIVRVSVEAVTDYGWTTCWEVGEAMFDAGRFNDKKNPAIVSVKTLDVKDWLKSQD